MELCKEKKDLSMVFHFSKKTLKRQGDFYCPLFIVSKITKTFWHVYLGNWIASCTTILDIPPTFKEIFRNTYMYREVLFRNILKYDVVELPCVSTAIGFSKDSSYSKLSTQAQLNFAPCDLDQKNPWF